MTYTPTLCPHCHQDTAIRNPSGDCDHLHYPEYCEVCRQREAVCTCGTCPKHDHQEGRG